MCPVGLMWVRRVVGLAGWLRCVTVLSVCAASRYSVDEETRTRTRLSVLVLQQ